MSTEKQSIGNREQFTTEDQIHKIHSLVEGVFGSLPKELAEELIKNGGAYQYTFSRMLERLLIRLTNVIVRTVKVDRNRTPQEVIYATGRILNIGNADDRVAEMPRGGGDDVEIIYFQLEDNVTNSRLKEEYKWRGLEPDPYAQAADNEAHPEFADRHRNGTQWMCSDGQWAVIKFVETRERFIEIERGDYDWASYCNWWFGGVRKKVQPSTFPREVSRGMISIQEMYRSIYDRVDDLKRTTYGDPQFEAIRKIRIGDLEWVLKTFCRTGLQNWR